MDRCIKYSLLLLAGLVLIFGFEAQAPSQAPAALPIVEQKKHESYTEKINDKASFEMIAIPCGTYLMGSPEG